MDDGFGWFKNEKFLPCILRCYKMSSESKFKTSSFRLMVSKVEVSD